MKKLIPLSIGVASALFIAKGLDNRIEKSYYDISHEKIPKNFNGFRILHISDYHNDVISGLANEIKDERPDIIVMTGDMTHDKGGPYTPAVNLIQQLAEIAPCYMVSGNHDIWRSDYEEFVSECKGLGVTFLRNESVKITKDNEQIIISGMEDVFTKTRMAQTIEKYLKHFSPTPEYQILLFHRANALDYLKDFGFDLILSGHMHGGQFRVPGLGGVLCPLSNLLETKKPFFPKYTAGLYDFDNSKMIVNRGLGNPAPLPRLYNRPEIGIITLHSL